MSVKILVADDSSTICTIVEMTFAAEDAEVITATTAEQALRAVAEQRPDVLLVDAALPGTDGYQMTKAIRSNDAVSSMSVIVMSSQQVKYDADRGRESGVNDHVVKPFDTQALIDRVLQAASRSRSARPSDGVSGSASPQSVEQSGFTRPSSGSAPAFAAASGSGSSPAQPRRSASSTMAFGSAPPSSASESERRNSAAPSGFGSSAGFGDAPSGHPSAESGGSSPSSSAGGGADAGSRRPVLELAEDIGAGAESEHSLPPSFSSQGPNGSASSSAGSAGQATVETGSAGPPPFSRPGGGTPPSADHAPSTAPRSGSTAPRSGAPSAGSQHPLPPFVGRTASVGGPTSSSAGAASPKSASSGTAAQANSGTAYTQRVSSELSRSLSGLNLTEQQIQTVTALSTDVVERIVWEVVPDLAETLIREEIRRLTRP